ncbi:hypothetical protein CK203_074076 [Vitis vinifera]|uniref:Uncharacterized protein n=1 Tax=Vitis vinifera TaxID=29760 RepID=A0A438E850_VITVI|nr:hypothetical protein CK203_074076 [Vitis vinifera]
MEVEVKIRLPDSSTHRAVSALLSSFHRRNPSANRTSFLTAPPVSSPPVAPSSASDSTVTMPAASFLSKPKRFWLTV